jgi:hypothetical protein
MTGPAAEAGVSVAMTDVTTVAAAKAAIFQDIVLAPFVVAAVSPPLQGDHWASASAVL